MSQGALVELGEHVATTVQGGITRIEFTLAGELCLYAERHRLIDLLTVLRDDPACDFKQLLDVCGVDFPHRPNRFEIVYNLLSITGNRRVRVKVETDENTAVPSVVSVFPTAGWFEREVWDMYGVFFDRLWF